MSYLKTPRIFGFTGIYRRIAYGLDILDDDLRISEGGHELLSAWEMERGLSGFMTSSGPGGEFRRELVRAVSQAMKKGCTCQAKSWLGWQRIADHLRPDGAGRREAAVLANRLRRTDLRQNPHDPGATRMRAELLEAVSIHGTTEDDFAESRFLRSVAKSCSNELAERLEAIDAFEAICVLVMAAFDLIRYLSARTTTPVTATDFSSYTGPRNPSGIVSEFPRALGRLARSFEVIGFGSLAEPLLKQYGDITGPTELFERILEHHEAAQSSKPPDGKRSWFDRDARGAMVRPLYRVDAAPAPTDLYTHPYRCSTAASFLRDLMGARH